MIERQVAPVASALPGELVDGKYRVERVLGRGGMGLVLLARNLLLDERVAIKVLVGKSTPALRSRLVMEARAAARLQSDYVVRVFDVGHTGSGDPYLVMEYLEGEPLSAMLEARGGRPVAQVVEWVLEACQGLAVAHCHGIVHRDLKPANLFLHRRVDGSTRLKVLDFGIAKLPEREGWISTTHPVGSPTYMAPEQFDRDLEVDARVDIWGLGVVLYEALTGKPPFAARSLLDLAAQLRNQAHVPVRARCAEVPEALSLAIDRCLAKRREDRPSLVELARAIAPFGSADAPAALARLERIGAGVEPGDTSSSGEAEVARCPALPGNATPEPGVMTPALSMSVAVPRARSQRIRSGWGWVLGAALAVALGYLLVLRPSATASSLPARTPAPLLELRQALLTQEAAKPAAAKPAAAEPTAEPTAGDRAVTPPRTPDVPAVGAGRNGKRKRTPAVARDATSASERQRARHVSEDVAHEPPAAGTLRPPAGPLPIDRQVTW